MDTPAYFAIIPAHIRYDKELDLGARLLYGELTALANKHGYCWATNRYFSELYDVDQSTIKRWLRSLKEQKHIIIEVEKSGIQTLRKIWISQEVKKIDTKVQICTPHDPTLACRGVKIELHNNTKSITEKKEDTPSPQASGLSFILLEEIKKTVPDIKNPDLVKWASEIEKMIRLDGRSPEKIEQMIRWLPTNDFWSKNILSPSKLRQKFDQLSANMNKSFQPAKEFSHEHWAQSVCKKLNHPEIECTREGIFFKTPGGRGDLVISYKENGFKDQVLSRLRKMNLDTTGL